MNRVDKNKITIEDTDVIVVGKIRNEEARLPYFLEYHRSIGVSKFIIVNNASVDNSQDFLLTQPDVMTYFTDQSYVEARQGDDWTNFFLDEYCSGKWALSLDADELLAYPWMEQITLPEFCAYLDAQKKNAFQTIMIDMYSDKPLKDVILNPGENFLEKCPYFDQNISFSDDRASTRRRLFWEENPTSNNAMPPVISKTPLVKWEKNFKYLASAHTIKDVTIADETGVLLHFKFFNSFYEQTEQAVIEKNYWNESAQYKVYHSKLRETPELSPYYEHSVKYTGSQQLIELGLVETTPEFKNYFRFLRFFRRIFPRTKN